LLWGFLDTDSSKETLPMSVATILLVDDDEVLRQVLRRVLIRDGYTVIEAGSVAQGLVQARDHKPELCLLDFSLPDGDGLELAKKIRTQGMGCPLILFTAYLLRLRDQSELSNVFARILTKPVNLQELREVISAALSGAAVASGPTPAVPEPADQPTVPPQPLPARSAPSSDNAAIAAPAQVRPWLSWLAVAAVAAAALIGLIFALPALGVPWIPNFFKSEPSSQSTTTSPTLGAQRVSTEADTLAVAVETVKRLGVTTEQATKADEPQPLELNGTLNLDPNYLARVHALFPGEVVELATVETAGTSLPRKRPLGFNDPVKEGDLLAVVWSKDLGEKKSELIDALSQQWLDEETLAKLEELYKDLATSEANLRLARKAVASDRNAVARAERTLRVWRLREEEIQKVKDEARRVYDRKGARDPAKEKDWARVEVRARFAGRVVEKNVALGDIVDTTTDLFKIADLSAMTAWVHVYDEYLPALQALPRPIPWKVEAGGETLTSPGAETISPVIDPNQHTALLMGRVDNPGGRLRVGQFVTATIDLPPPPDLTAVPAGAVVEDGIRSIVFVKAEQQPDPKAVVFSLRRVAVVQRLPKVLLVRAHLSAEEKAAGLRELHPGEEVAVRCVVELKGELESQQEPAKPGQ
jgi:membrane fusion protein, heavy metal efflux system